VITTLWLMPMDIREQRTGQERKLLASWLRFVTTDISAGPVAHYDFPLRFRFRTSFSPKIRTHSPQLLAIPVSLQVGYINLSDLIDGKAWN